jgi:hypothetical protein
MLEALSRLPVSNHHITDSTGSTTGSYQPAGLVGDREMTRWMRSARLSSHAIHA